MIKREAKSSIVFRHWIRANPQFTGAYEMKDSKGKSNIPFSCVEDHQLNYGMAIKSPKGVLIRVQGTNGEPDYIYLRNAPSWVVIKFPNCFEIIDVETFIMEKKRSKQKSLTSIRARAISVVTVPTRS
jgi:hypothetical protein